MAESVAEVGGSFTEAVFQSSSYWRMAERSLIYSVKLFRTDGFNPHHTGEWMKDSK